MAKTYKYGFVIEGESEKGVKSIRKVREEVMGLDAQTGKAGTATKNWRGETDKQTSALAKHGKELLSVKNMIIGIAGATGITMLIGKFKDTSVETEKLRGSLVTITGSTESAGKAFEKLTEFAGETPFTLDQSVNAFIKLKALGLDPSERAMMSYGNTASAMGKDMMQMIEAVADASTGEFERLEEFGIKAKSEGDNVSLTFQGVTTTIGKNSEEIQGYLLAIGETQFAGAMENQMSRLPGLLSNLSDNFDGLFRKIGDSGGINLFGAAVTAVSGALIFLTDNLDIVATGAMAMGAALAVLVGPSAIIAGIGLISKAVLALNAAFLANPIAIIVAAMAAAAVVIYRNWDTITAAAEKSAVSIELGWNKLKLFLMDAFAPALTAISGMFQDIQFRAIATWEAVAAAARDPLSAIDTFNSTFDGALQRLRDGATRSNTFADSIVTTRGRITELEGRLWTMTNSVASVGDATEETTFSLSDFKTEVKGTTDESDKLNKKAQDVITALGNEKEALHLSSTELDIRNRLQSAGVDRTSELGQQIVGLTTEIHKEREATDKASQAAKDLEKANDQAAKESADAWGRTHEYLSSTFVDIMDNGGNAFDNIAKAFEKMVKRMVAEWAASGLIGLFTGNGLSGFSMDAFAGGNGNGGGLGSLTSMGNLGSTVFGSSGPAPVVTSVPTYVAAGTAGTAATSGLTTAGISSGGSLGGLAGTVGAGAAVGSASAGGASAAALGAGAVGGLAGVASAGGATTAAIGAGGALGGVGGTVGVGAAGTAAGGGLTTALAAIPVWGWIAAAVLAAAALLSKDPTYSGNAGLLIHDAPGAPADQKFAVDPFESGFAPIGFARRADQAAALESINALRSIDSTLSQISRNAGLTVEYSNNPFGGFDENGEHSGLFLGQAFEDGKATGTSFEDQSKKFAQDWILALGDQVTARDQNYILDGESADEIVARAAETIKLQETIQAENRSASMEMTAEFAKLIEEVKMLRELTSEIGKGAAQQRENSQRNDIEIGRSTVDGLSAVRSAVISRPASPLRMGNEVTA